MGEQLFNILLKSVKSVFCTYSLSGVNVGCSEQSELHRSRHFALRNAHFFMYLSENLLDLIYRTTEYPAGFNQS